MKGAVATGHPLCTEVALEVLRSGGNAFDGALAAGFMAMLAEPMLASLGGGGYLLARTHGGDHRVFDFFVNVPGRGRPGILPKFLPIDVAFGSTTQRFQLGPGSVAVPGVMKGFYEIHQRLGHLPLRDIIAPTVERAKTGVTVCETQAYVLRILDPIMLQEEEGKGLYAPEGKLLGEGDLFRNPLLADFLSHYGEGLVRDFYEGDLSKKYLDTLEEWSPLSSEDLVEYKVQERESLIGKYRDYSLYTCSRPSLGGTMILEMLSAAEKVNFQKMDFGSYMHLSELARLMVEIESRKSDFVATKGTTHISVSDSQGNMASLSLSNGEGSGHFVPGTGVMLNNMLGEDDVCEDYSLVTPGARLPSMMSPCILERDEEHAIVIGSGGSKRIRSSITQVVMNLVDFNMSLEEAVKSPRINWDGSYLQVEPGFSSATMDRLSVEIPVNLWPQPAFYFGGTHSVLPNSQAQGDFRRGGKGSIL